MTKTAQERIPLTDATSRPQRQRAPSARSLQTRDRILDAAERVFARAGFDAAAMRDIAAEAGVRVGLVHHHSGGKEELFNLVVARRAKELSDLRLQALAERQAAGPLEIAAVIDCFVGPYLRRLRQAGPQWLAYGRLVAIVSADPRWAGLAARHFDPTAGRFIDMLAGLLPHLPRRVLAAGFVYMVAAMLAQLAAAWRVDVLGGQAALPDDLEVDRLVAYCASGLQAMASVPDPT